MALPEEDIAQSFEYTEWEKGCVFSVKRDIRDDEEKVRSEFGKGRSANTPACLRPDTNDLRSLLRDQAPCSKKKG